MIRKGTMADFDAGCQASFLDAATNNTVLPLDIHRFYATVERAVLEGRTYVAEVDGKIVGSMAFSEFTPDYSSHSGLQDLWINIAQEHRGSSVGGRLLSALREEARIRNLPWFVGATGKAPEAIALYEKHFEPVSRIYRGK